MNSASNFSIAASYSFVVFSSFFEVNENLDNEFLNDTDFIVSSELNTWLNNQNNLLLFDGNNKIELDNTVIKEFDYLPSIFGEMNTFLSTFKSWEKNKLNLPDDFTVNQIKHYPFNRKTSVRLYVSIGGNSDFGVDYFVSELAVKYDIDTTGIIISEYTPDQSVELDLMKMKLLPQRQI
ncbi:MAG: hypothetical protein L3J44_02995 [Campylobacteraceae bacterium]|nr:hypothetical protein [Campylobacteraceae bacterium]